MHELVELQDRRCFIKPIQSGTIPLNPVLGTGFTVLCTVAIGEAICAVTAAVDCISACTTHVILPDQSRCLTQPG